MLFEHLLVAILTDWTSQRVIFRQGSYDTDCECVKHLDKEAKDAQDKIGRKSSGGNVLIVEDMQFVDTKSVTILSAVVEKVREIERFYLFFCMHIDVYCKNIC
jgi:hypothetical protein